MAQRLVAFFLQVPLGSWLIQIRQGVTVIDKFDNPFMHEAFLRACEMSITNGPVDVISHAGYKLAFTQGRSSFAFGMPFFRICSHGYAPLGACFLPSEANAMRSVEGFSNLLDTLRQSSKADFVFWPYFPVETMEYGALKDWLRDHVEGLQPIETRSHVRAFLDSSDPKGEEGLSGLSLRKKKRKELGRQSRRMADLGVVHLVSTWQGLDHKDAINHFLAVEASGWKGGKGTALASDHKLIEMVNHFLPQMLEERKAQIDLMLLNGDCVAGMISLRAGRGLFTWKIGMDDKFARFSPGVQMMLEVSRMAIADKTIDYVDSLADPDHPMIDHLWGGRRAYSTLFIPFNRKGALGAQAMNIAMASKDQARLVAKKLMGRQ